jgi:hypothetical protein
VKSSRTWETLGKKKLTMCKRANGVRGCDGLNLDGGSGIQKLCTEYSQANRLESHLFEAEKRKMKGDSLGG